MRLDIFVSNKFKINRSSADYLITNGFILVNEEVITKKNYQVKNNDIILKKITKPSIEILYENSDIAIVHKPNNISVCRTFNTPKNEFVLNEELQKKIPLSGAIKTHEFGLPHRLDKATEGLIIITKNDKIYEKIINCFNNKTIKKQYIAAINKTNINLQLLKTFICEHGYINFSIYNHEKCICDIDNEYENISISYTEKMDKVHIGGDKIMTTLVKKEKEDLMLCIPITGVRHQIRVTLNYLNTPIVGDTLYNGAINDQLLLSSIFIGIPINIFD